MSALPGGAIGRLDERDDVLQQFVVEGILGGVRGHHLPARWRPAGRHDDNHRDGLLLRQQVVEDVVRPSNRGPGHRRVAAAVNQVEHGKTPGPLLVSWRRIHVHLTPGVVERLGRIAGESNGAVRHVSRLGEVAGHRQQALHLRLARRHVDVARVDNGDAVDGEGVAPRAGPDGPGRRATPDAALAFRHRDRGRAAAPSALRSRCRGLRWRRIRIGNETAVDVPAHGDGRGVRRQQSEGHATIRFDLRRDDRRAASATAAPGCRCGRSLRRRRLGRLGLRQRDKATGDDKRHRQHDTTSLHSTTPRKCC